jgi:hypothetical protein
MQKSYFEQGQWKNSNQYAAVPKAVNPACSCAQKGSQPIENLKGTAAAPATKALPKATGAKISTGFGDVYCPTCQEPPAPGLSFEWYTVVSELKAFLGEDPEVTVTTDAADPDSVNVIVNNNCAKTAALASLLRLTYEIGAFVGHVYVRDQCGNAFDPLPLPTNDALGTAAAVAFADNPRVCSVQSFDMPFSGERVFVLVEKAVIQYFDDDIGDPYANANKLSANVLIDILDVDTDLGVSTILCRDVEVVG